MCGAGGVQCCLARAAGLTCNTPTHTHAHSAVCSLPFHARAWLSQLLEGDASREVMSAKEEVQEVSRQNRRHYSNPDAMPPPPPPPAAAPSSPSLHLNAAGRPTRVVRLRRPPPPAGGGPASRAQSAPRRRPQQSGDASGGDTGGGGGTRGTTGGRSVTALRSRPAFGGADPSVTFHDRVVTTGQAAGSRPVSRKGSGRRRLDARHQYHEVSKFSKAFTDTAVHSSELVVIAPAGRRSNTGTPLSLAHPD